MKWPETLTLVRHDTSTYNSLRPLKDADPLYQAFKKSYEEDPTTQKTVDLALQVRAKYYMNLGDHNTPLAEDGGQKAETMARNLGDHIPRPEVIFVSPYSRTLATLERMTKGWPDLKDVPTFEEERIREKEHGMYLLYNDWRVFFALNPDQRVLSELEGEYWFKFPQGEHVPDVRERNRSWLTTLTRDYASSQVLAITHHITILATRANLERLSADEFIRLDAQEKPINCGVTIYRGKPELGKDGKLVLDRYNAKLY